MHEPPASVKIRYDPGYSAAKTCAKSEIRFFDMDSIDCALEQLLITKCDELTRDRDDLARKYTELVKVNKQIERDYEEFRGSITKLMTGR